MLVMRRMHYASEEHMLCAKIFPLPPVSYYSFLLFSIKRIKLHKQTSSRIPIVKQILTYNYTITWLMALTFTIIEQ